VPCRSRAALDSTAVTVGGADGSMGRDATVWRRTRNGRWSLTQRCPELAVPATTRRSRLRGRWVGNGVTELGEPNGAAAAGFVFHFGGDDGETSLVEQSPVFGGIKAGVI
jgi:hypothetical protein